MAKAQPKEIPNVSEDFAQRKSEFEQKLAALEEEYGIKVLPYVNPTLVVRDMKANQETTNEQKTEESD